jgi:hypothetical protein
MFLERRHVTDRHGPDATAARSLRRLNPARLRRELILSTSPGSSQRRHGIGAHGGAMETYLTFVTAGIAILIFATMAALPWLVDLSGSPEERLTSRR